MPFGEAGVNITCGPRAEYLAELGETPVIKHVILHKRYTAKRGVGVFEKSDNARIEINARTPMRVQFWRASTRRIRSFDRLAPLWKKVGNPPALEKWCSPSSSRERETDQTTTKSEAQHQVQTRLSWYRSRKCRRAQR